MRIRAVTYFVVAFTFMSVEYVGAQTVIDDRAIAAAVRAEATQPPPVLMREEPRPPVLVPLYLSLAALHVADTVATVQAVREHDAREMNPAMRPFAGDHAALLLIKSASMAGTVFAVEKLWKRNRAAAIITMIGINAAYAAVVSNNLRAVR
jgi:hypothetical protein